MQRRVFYFHHIPKTAGTSVRLWLASCFGDNMCPAGIADGLVTIPSRELGRYSVFSGHFHSYLPQYLEREVIAFTVLRDPVARTRSHWHEVRRTAQHPHHARVCSQNFAEFVDDNRNRVMIENYQTRYLTNLQINMRELAQRFSPDELSRYALAEALEQASMSVAKPILAASVNETLGNMSVVGVCERLHDFLVKVSRILEVPAPSVEAVPRANVTEKDDAGGLPAAALARLRELTRIDQELYESVCAQL